MIKNTLRCSHKSNYFTETSGWQFTFFYVFDFRTTVTVPVSTTFCHRCQMKWSCHPWQPVDRVRTRVAACCPSWWCSSWWPSWWQELRCRSSWSRYGKNDLRTALFDLGSLNLWFSRLNRVFHNSRLIGRILTKQKSPKTYRHEQGVNPGYLHSSQACWPLYWSVFCACVKLYIDPSSCMSNLVQFI